MGLNEVSRNILAALLGFESAQGKGASVSSDTLRSTIGPNTTVRSFGGSLSVLNRQKYVQEKDHAYRLTPAGRTWIAEQSDTHSSRAAIEAAKRVDAVTRPDSVSAPALPEAGTAEPVVEAPTMPTTEAVQECASIPERHLRQFMTAFHELHDVIIQIARLEVLKDRRDILQKMVYDDPMFARIRDIVLPK